MITKLRKAQDSWAAKAVFTLTALSFVSLFGVSGYLNSAAENPAVIKVNDNGLSLAEFNQQIDEQIRMARRLFGDNIEVTDEIRNSIASELVQKNLKKNRCMFWRRQWHPTPVLLPRKSHGRRSLVGCSPWGRYK